MNEWEKRRERRIINRANSADQLFNQFAERKKKDIMLTNSLFPELICGTIPQLIVYP